LNGRYRNAVDFINPVIDSSDATVGVVYEKAAARTYAIISLAHLGRFRDLQRLQDEGLRAANARGDTFGSVMLSIGYSALRWLVDDRADLVEAHTEAAMAAWSKNGFHLEHYYALVGRIFVAGYRDETEQAHTLADELLRRAKGSLLWRIQALRIRAWHLRAQWALASMARGLGDREALLKQSVEDARRIERERVPYGAPFTSLVRAGVAFHRGARDEALRGLDSAARAFDAASMKAYAAATRDLIARASGVETAESEIAAAEEVLRAEGAVVPSRVIASLVPRFTP
jgi:hypothetical protein